MKNFKKSLRFLKDSKKELIILLVISILTSIISIITPTLLGKIITCFLNEKYNSIILIVIILGITSLISLILNILSSKSYQTIKKNFILNIRKSLLKNALNFNLESFNKNGQGFIINKVKDDTKDMASDMTSLKNYLLVIITNLGTIIYIYTLNIYIAIIYTFFVILSILIRYKGIKKKMFYKKHLLNKQDENANLIGEVVRGIKDIKILGLKNTFNEKTTSSFTNLGNLEYKVNIFLDIYNKLANFIEAVSIGIVTIISIILIKNNLLSIDTFIIIFMYKNSVFSFSKNFSSSIENLKNLNLCCDRVFAIIDNNDTTSSENFGNFTKEKCLGKISFNNVTFKYDKVNILTNFNLNIKECEYLGIIGLSGSGKTTLLNLISKLYTPQKGSIKIDDIDINEYNEDFLRNNISLINQDAYLFDFSILENLKYVKEDISFEDIKAVLKLVKLDEMIETLPKKYNTKVGEGGVSLSSGEKQRLVIARTLLLNRPILLLDEITSNLDDINSEIIKKIIISLKGKYTIIQISHDIDILSECDRIIKFDKGKIIEEKI